METTKGKRLSTERKTLVLFPGALGDFVCFLPALEALRASRERRVMILSAPRFSELVAGSDIEVRGLEGEPSAWLFSRRPPPEAERFFGAFDEILCFTGSQVPEVLVNLERWGGSAFPFRPESPIHLARHFLRCVGASSVGPLQARLPRLASVTRRGARWRRQAGLNNVPLLIVHPGSGGSAKRWSEAGFLEVARRWRHRGGVVRVVLGPAERDEVSRWPVDGIVLDPSLEQLAGLLPSGEAYLGNDSGVSHLAAVSGARGAVLFGPTDPELWRPLSNDLRVVRPRPWSGIGSDALPEAIHIVDQELGRLAGFSVP